MGNILSMNNTNGRAPIPVLEHALHPASHLADQPVTMYHNKVLEIVERTMSSISILGFLIIFTTFLCFESFNRKLFNRLVFYASFGNVASNVATLISRSTIDYAGVTMNEGLCRFQGFLIQWFMPADALWALCMALNVFFAFRTTRSNIDFRRLGLVYVGVCYGIPFVPAAVYLILDVTRNQGFYGPATLWCWISESHEALRLITFYGPVWVVIVAIAGFYGHIYHSLDTAESCRHKFETDTSSSRTDRSESVETEPAQSTWSAETFAQNSSKMTEIIQFSEQSVPNLRELSHGSESSTITEGSQPQTADAPAAVTVTSPIPMLPYSKPSALSRQRNSNPSADIEVSTLCYADLPAKPTKQQGKRKTLTVTTSRTNRGAKTYTLVAFVIFLALLIVWVPATVNRIWGLIAGKVPIGIDIAAGIVLPLQGFFNCVVYLFFSRAELRMEVRKFMHGSGMIRDGNTAPTSLATPGFGEDVEKGRMKKRVGSMYPGLECDDQEAEEEVIGETTGCA